MTLAAGAPTSQQVLAERLHLEKSTVSRLVKHLEQRGWVKRVRDFHDTRMSDFILYLFSCSVLFEGSCKSPCSNIANKLVVEC